MFTDFLPFGCQLTTVRQKSQRPDRRIAGSPDVAGWPGGRVAGWPGGRVLEFYNLKNTRDV